MMVALGVIGGSRPMPRGALKCMVIHKSCTRDIQHVSWHRKNKERTQMDDL